MKLLVFAHVPPPHHGQSYMVQIMLAGLGGDHRRAWEPASGANHGIACYHVNARLSRRLEEIGDLRVGKLVLLLGYCLQAIWCRFRYRVPNLYYIPAPGKRSALYRDWVVMLLCRPFFKRIILHWHAAGLAKWLETNVQIRTRAFTYQRLKQVDLSIVLSRYNRADAEKLFSKRIKVVSNGIPDPCPAFATQVLPRRQARFAARQKLLAGQSLSRDETRAVGGDPEVVRVFYLAHCTREKGLFDTVTAVALANQRLTDRAAPVRLRLVVAGTFVSEAERTEFDEVLARPGTKDWMEYLGFVSGEQKERLLQEADIFCFPTYYRNENQPVNLIEAMAFGLPILTTRWRSLPELFPANYPGLVRTQSPEQVAEGLLALLTWGSGAVFRDDFLIKFTLERHIAGLADALRSSETAPEDAPAVPPPAPREP